MSKAQWKQPALKQAEKKVADREQAVQEAKFWKERCEALQTQNIMLTAERNDATRQVFELRGKAGAYDFLRREGVVLMSDEPKHLQGDDMDKYIEHYTWNSLSGKSPSNRVLRQLIDADRLSSDPAGLRLRKQGVAVSMLDEAADNLARHIDEHIKFKATGRYNIGTDTGSESKEADQKDSGHYTDILRYAHRYGLR